MDTSDKIKNAKKLACDFGLTGKDVQVTLDHIQFKNGTIITFPKEDKVNARFTKTFIESQEGYCFNFPD